MAIHQPVQAVCEVKWVKRRRLEEAISSTVHILPAAVAEGGLLVKSYLWRLFHGVNTQYSLYRTVQKLKKTV